MTESYPVQIVGWADDATEKDAALLMGIIGAIRNIRSETGIHPSAAVEASVICPDGRQAATLRENESAIKSLARAESVTVLGEGTIPRGAASVIYNDIEIFVPLKGLVDIDAEIAKLDKERGKMENELAKVTGKLSNAKFMDKAPEQVVTKEKEKQETLQAKLAKIEEGVKRLSSLK